MLYFIERIFGVIFAVAFGRPRHVAKAFIRTTVVINFVAHVTLQIIGFKTYSMDKNLPECQNDERYLETTRLGLGFWCLSCLWTLGFTVGIIRFIFWVCRLKKG